MTKDEALKLAAQAVLDRWNNPKWVFAKQGPTADLMSDLQKALAQPAQPAPAQPARLTVPEHLDVRRIMLAIVPGDGSGHEVYAKSVKDVEKTLTKMDERIEELEALAKAVVDVTPPAAQPVGQAPCAKFCESTAYEIVIRGLKGNIERMKAAQQEQPNS